MQEFCCFLSKFLGRVTEDGASRQKNKPSAKAWMRRGMMCTAKPMRREGRGRARRVRVRGAALRARRRLRVCVEFFVLFGVLGGLGCSGVLVQEVGGREKATRGGVTSRVLCGRGQPDPAFRRRTGRRPRGPSLALLHLARASGEAGPGSQPDSRFAALAPIGAGNNSSRAGERWFPVSGIGAVGGGGGRGGVRVKREQISLCSAPFVHGRRIKEPCNSHNCHIIGP